MADPPLITVAIPTFNGSRHLPETLRSVLGQSGVSFDLLICDDRSTDETLETARAVGGDRLRIVSNAERLGLAGNWNQCVRQSRTPLVAVIHQDDVLRPGHLAAHVRSFEADPSVGLVASASGVIDDSGVEVSPTVVERGGLGEVDRTFSPGEAIPMMVSANPLRCSAVSIRSAAHEQVGGFDPESRYVVDWDFWLRVARLWSLAWLARPTVDVRWHLASETHRFKTGVNDLEETERLIRKVFEDFGQPLPRKSSAHRRLSRAYLNRAHVSLRGGNGNLARTCLLRSLRFWPGVLRVILADPRLAAQMATVWAAPGISGRLFGRQDLR